MSNTNLKWAQDMTDCTNVSALNQLDLERKAISPRLVSTPHPDFFNNMAI